MLALGHQVPVGLSCVHRPSLVGRGWSLPRAALANLAHYPTSGFMFTFQPIPGTLAVRPLRPVNPPRHILESHPYAEGQATSR
jgi:hypothetical protein